jgi:DNA-binding transcriptional LysR family regulator
MSARHINISMLRAFIALAEERSFSKAGARVGMTQSGMSHAIRGLEEAVGATLVARSRGGVELTEAGNGVVAEAKSALEAVQRMCLLGSSAASIKGRVKIGLVPSAAARLAPPVIQELRRSYPGIEYEVLEGTDQEICGWLDAGIIDLGVGTESRADIVAEPLVEDELMLVAPVDHPILRATPLKLAALQGEPFVMPGSGCEPVINRFLQRAGVTVNISLRVREMNTLVAMVHAGLGVSIVPSMALPMTGRSVVTRGFNPHLSRTLFLLHRRLPLNLVSDVTRQAFVNYADKRASAPENSVRPRSATA